MGAEIQSSHTAITQDTALLMLVTLRGWIRRLSYLEQLRAFWGEQYP